MMHWPWCPYLPHSSQQSHSAQRSKTPHQGRIYIVTFVNQKNGKIIYSQVHSVAQKTWTSALSSGMEPRSNKTSGLCLLLTVPPTSTPFFSIAKLDSFPTLASFRSYARGKATFKFDSHIRNKSIPLGTAMACFITDISTARIMILGHWSPLMHSSPTTSDPKSCSQWTKKNMSREMIFVDSFFDVQMNHRPPPPAPPPWQPQNKSKPIQHFFQWPSSRDPQSSPESLDCSTAWKTISGEAFWSEQKLV